jgi:Holliday junction DNA helicase RuvA
MIHFLRGILAEKSENSAIIDVGGVGFQALISLMTYRELPRTGEQVFLHTTLILREDDVKIYGFHSTDEREFFGVLLGLSGIGPKVALDILSHISIEHLADAVQRNEPGRLNGIPGIGKKRAEKLLFELQRTKSPIFLNAARGVNAHAPARSEDNKVTEALDALIALGLKPFEAQRAIAEAQQELGDDAPVTALIKEGLRRR